MEIPQTRTAQRVVRLAERISGSALPSLQDIYLKRCKSRAAKIIKDSTHPPGWKTIFSVYCHLASASGAWWQKLRDWELLPPGHQAPKLKLSLITSTRLNLINFIVTVLLLCVYTRYNLFAHSSCTSRFILLFIKSTVNCIAHFTLYFFLLLL